MAQLLYLSACDAVRRKSLRGEAVPRWLLAAINVPWVVVLSSVVAVAGWLLWVVNSQLARGATHDVVAGFGVQLLHDPWPLWSPVPVSCAVLPLLALLGYTAGARARIQRRVAAGGTPFPSPSGAEGEVLGRGDEAGAPSGLSPEGYFVTVGAATTAAWLVHAWLASLLVCFGVWAAALACIRSAAHSATPYGRPLTTASAESTTVDPSLWAVTGGGVAAGALAAAAAAPAPASGWSKAGWGPDFPGPGGFCPPSCLNLSPFSRYLSNDTCCCNVIGGVFAAEAPATAGVHHVTLAMVGLAALWAALSWMMMDAGCQFAHSQSEALLCSETTCAAAAAAGGPGKIPAVRRLSDWMLRRMGGRGGGRTSGSANPVGGGAADPLLIPGSP